MKERCHETTRLSIFSLTLSFLFVILYSSPILTKQPYNIKKKAISAVINNEDVYICAALQTVTNCMSQIIQALSTIFV